MPKDSFYDLPAGHKWCPRCDEIKPVEEFYTTPGSGRISECRPCNKVMRASHSEANRERLSAKAKDYYIENRERILARIKARQQERHALSSGRVSK
jgi:phage FluMu protein Com